MIITVTMNPALDRTIALDKMERGSLNRIEPAELDAGGKGINVSRTVKALGGKTIATGFLGGSAGESMRKMLSEQGISCDFVQVQGETRTNTKIMETGLSILTELNEPGPLVTGKEISGLMEKLERYAGPDTLVVLSGSIPRGVDKNIYYEITKHMHQKGASVLLDADGDLFASGVKAVPDIVKPNQKELEEYYRLQDGCGRLPEPESDMENQEILAARLRAMGIPLAAVSLGEKGALFMEGDTCYQCPGLSVKALSTVGAGDAMVAALALGWEQKLSLRETAALGMAVSAGAVMTPGTKPPEMAVVKDLLRQVKVEAV